MTQLAAPADQPTTEQTPHNQEGVWGHFAQTLDLPARLASIPLAQKTVKHTPAAKLLTLFLSLRSGSEHLSDLSSSAAPLYRAAPTNRRLGAAVGPDAAAMGHRRAARRTGGGGRSGRIRPILAWQTRQQLLAGENARQPAALYLALG